MMSYLYFILALLLEVSFATIHKKPPLTTVHLVPHSHDDVGWLHTIDGYFYGVKDVYEATKEPGVYHIITSVIDALLDNSDRKFT